jgi:two-component system chemotaxis response regulator CheY
MNKESPMHVLLVDDSSMMRSLQKRALTTIGDVTFAEAGDGVEALTAISAHPEGFQLIFVDCNMPNMDGITLVKRIRASDKVTPIVMVTTEGEKKRVIEAIKAGANNYIVKPFTTEAFIERVKLTLVLRSIAA